MISAIWLPENQPSQQGGVELVDSWRQQGGQLWLDLQGESASDERRLLRQKFDIPDLAIDDAQRSRHPPKLERLESYLFLIWRGLHAQTDSMDFRTIQIAIWMGDNVLITRHSDDSPSIEKARQQVIGADHLVPSESVVLRFAQRG